MNDDSHIKRREVREVKWTSQLDEKVDDRDQLIWLEQAEGGEDPDTKDIFDLSTNPRIETEDEVKTISIYYKDIPRIICLLSNAWDAVKEGRCRVKPFFGDYKEELEEMR